VSTCKNLPKCSGVYKITNIVTGDFYIGSSVNIYKRVACHLASLRSHTHTNKYLQSVWNKYKEENFLIITLLICEQHERFRYEQEFINSLNPKYNLVKNVVGLTGHPLTDEHKKKISSALTGRKHTEESKRRMSQARKGVKQTPEQIEARSIKLKGLKKSDEWKNKIRDSLLGKKFTQERIQNMSTGRAGKSSARPENFEYFSPKEFRLISPTGELIIGKNLKKFCKDRNLNYNNISKVCRGTMRSSAGWRID
jgi:group I intron endonuclease